MERGRTSADLARNLEIMGKCLSHRGPDHQAQWVAENRLVGLVHRRLSIIDLSVDGNQPMRSPSGRFVVTFNGEIYNYIELRAELEARGDHSGPSQIRKCFWPVLRIGVWREP